MNVFSFMISYFNHFRNKELQKFYKSIPNFKSCNGEFEANLIHLKNCLS
jgi:hypothetical protein